LLPWRLAKGDPVRIFLLILLLLAVFVAGVLTSPKIAATNFAQIDLSSFGKCIDYWANRYQTFLGVLVAIGVAYLTVAAMSKQTSISERQFLSGQVQGLLVDRGNLQFVIAQLTEVKMQTVLFENNISFLDTAGDQISGWQNGGNLIRTAYGNIENFRSLISANTAKFMGPTGTRSALISKLDAIVGSQDEIREAFLNWANLNRNANADLASPIPPQKAAYIQVKGKVIALFTDLLPLATEAAAELKHKVDQVENDIAVLQKSIDSKSSD
jgi:hypothetical protein